MEEKSGKEISEFKLNMQKLIFSTKSCHAKAQNWQLRLLMTEKVIEH